MRVVLDTAILIDHLRGAPEAVEYLESLEQRPGCSEVTRIEVVTADCDRLSERRQSGSSP